MAKKDKKPRSWYQPSVRSDPNKASGPRLVVGNLFETVLRIVILNM